MTETKVINNLTIQGKQYYPVDEYESCDGCVFNFILSNGDDSKCHEACDITNSYCINNNKIWKPIEMQHKSITQEIKDFDLNSVNLDVQIPGTKYDQDKLQYTLIPPHALAEVARNLTIGLKKYKERDNWKKVPNAEQRYLDALYRHLEAHRKGEIYDPDSSVPDMYHLSAVIVNAMFLLEFLTNAELKSGKV